MYAVEIEVEKGEYTLVRKENPWTYNTEVRTFETKEQAEEEAARWNTGRCLLYTSPSPRDGLLSRMPSSA